jgi:hypothetical protein
VFAGLGSAPGSKLYKNSLYYNGDGVVTNIAPLSGWRWIDYLGRYGFLFPGAGSTAMITIPSYIPSDGDFTFCAWSNIPSGTAAPNCILSCHTSTATNWFLLYTNTTFGTAVNQLRIYMNAEIGVGSDIRDGLWHHLALVRRGSSFKLYLDLNLDIDATYSGSVGNQYNQLGNSNRTSNNDRSHGGFMVDSLIYHRALTLSELEPLADPKNINLSGLIRPYKRRVYSIRRIRRFKVGKLLVKG